MCQADASTAGLGARQPPIIERRKMVKGSTAGNVRQSPPQQKGICMSALSDPDSQPLQGVWEQTSLEDSGVLNPIDAHSAPGALTTISGDRFEVKTVSGEVLLAGRFFLDSSTVPKALRGWTPWAMTPASTCPPVIAWRGIHLCSLLRMKVCPDPSCSVPAPAKPCALSCAARDAVRHPNARQQFHKAFTFSPIG